MKVRIHCNITLSSAHIYGEGEKHIEHFKEHHSYWTGVSTQNIVHVLYIFYQGDRNENIFYYQYKRWATHKEPGFINLISISNFKVEM